MKRNLSRIYDKNKVNSRRKYAIIIFLILLLQLALFLGTFSKAEKVLAIEYVNYYTMENVESSIQIENDLDGDYIILPESVNERNVIKYYIEETIEEEIELSEYKPNDKYYVKEDITEISVKVEYEALAIVEDDTNESEENNVEYILGIDEENNVEDTPEIDEENNAEDIPEIDEENNVEDIPEIDEENNVEDTPEIDEENNVEDTTEIDKENNLEDTTEIDEENNLEDTTEIDEENNAENAPEVDKEITETPVQDSTDITVEEPEEILPEEEEERTVIYLGECGQEGEEGTELNPYKSIEMAFEALSENGGKIVIKGFVEIEEWASEKVALNKNVIIESYNDDSVMYMEGDWVLQANTTFTNVKISMSETKQGLNIYANGYDLVLGIENQNESLKIAAKSTAYYPNVYGGSNYRALSTGTNVTINSGIYQNIYGGSNSKAITGNVNLNLNINYAVCQGNIYGGSNSSSIVGNTNLNIKYAKVNGSIYGSSNNGSLTGTNNVYIEMADVTGSIYGSGIYNGISGSNTLHIKNANVGKSVYGGGQSQTQSSGTSTTIIESGNYGTTISGENEIAISGGNNVGTRGGITLTIKDATVHKGCIAGAAGTSSIYQDINFTIEKIKLGSDGKGTNSIYGFGYDGGTNVQCNINMNVSNVTGSPKYITGYSNTATGTGIMSGAITMNLSNISGIGTVCGGSLNGTQTKNIKSTITTNSVSGNILTAGGNVGDSLGSYNITINGGSFLQGIYVGTSTSLVKNVVNEDNTLVLNNYGSSSSYKNLYHRFRFGIIRLNNSYVKTSEKFHYADLYLVNSKMEVASINDPNYSVRKLDMNANSELSIKNTTNLCFKSNISGNGKLKLQDATNLYTEGNITGSTQIDITENSNITDHYISIISNKTLAQSVFYFNRDLTQYKTDYSMGTNTFWKFYVNNNDLEGQADCVYLDGTYGNDNNSGELKSPVKTIAAASNIIKNNSSKKKVVLLSNLDLNKETAKATDTSNVYTVITATDGNRNYNKYVNLNSTTNNIYQNLEFKDVQINSASGRQNIYLNGNKLRINTNVKTNEGSNGYQIYIYGGSLNTDLNVDSSNIEIKSGYWTRVYGGNASGTFTGNSNITISGAVVNNSIYGGNSAGTFIGNSNITMSSGYIWQTFGGNEAGTFDGDAKTTLSGAHITGTIYGGSNTGVTTGNTNVTISSGSVKKIYGGSVSGAISKNTNVKITGGSIEGYVYGGSDSGNIAGDIIVSIEGGTLTSNIYGANGTNGTIGGTINLNITKGTFSTASTIIYAGGNNGSVNDIITNISNMKFTNTIQIYGGGYDTTVNGDITLNIENTTTAAATIYGGGYSDVIHGNINLNLIDTTIASGTVYRGSNTSEVKGTLNSTFENLSFTSTSSYLYLGSNSGKINGSINEEFKSGMFKDNKCNATVYAGSNSGTITGDVTFSATGLTFGNEVYGGCNSGTINGNVTITIDNSKIGTNFYGGTNTGAIDGNTIVLVKDSTITSNLYGLGNIKSSTARQEANTNTTTIKNTTVGGTLFVVKDTGNRVLGDINAEIDEVNLKQLYAFKSYSNAINKKVNISITNSKTTSANIYTGTVQSNSGADLTNVLTMTLDSNTPQFNFGTTTNIENLNIIGGNIIVNGVLKATNLSLANYGTLDLEKSATVTGTFAGDATGKYGKIYVYDGLRINKASGKTILEIGTILGDISNDKLSFVKSGDLSTDISKINTETGVELREWTIGRLDSLEIVFVDGANGSDDNSGESAAEAVKTLKTAYYYCKNAGGTIVVCGPTTMTEWPSHSAKKVVLTSKYDGIDYRNIASAKLTLNSNDNTKSAVNLRADTTFEYLNLVMSKQQNIYANGYKLTMGVEGDTSSLKVTNTSNITTTAYLDIYGGTYNASVNNTNIIINSGSYKSIYAGNTGNYAVGNDGTKGTEIVSIKITGGEFGNSASNNTIVCGNLNASSQGIYGGINLSIINANITGRILSSGYTATTHGNVNVNIGKNVKINGDLFTDQSCGNINSNYKHILNIDGTGGTTTINNLYYGSLNRNNSSYKYETNITNATVSNIYYGAQNTSSVVDTVKARVDLNINQGAKIANIYAGRYFANDTSQPGEMYIKINTNEDLSTNIYRKSKNSGGAIATVCDITFDGRSMKYSGNIESVTGLNILNSSTINMTGNISSPSNLNISGSSVLNMTGNISSPTNLNILGSSTLNTTKNISNANNIQISNMSTLDITGSTFGVSNLNIDNSSLNIGNTVTALTLGNVNINTNSTMKLLNSAKTIRITGNLVGGGKLYLNDDIRLEISGIVTNSTTVYCNDTTKYFDDGTLIIAQYSDTTLENAFVSEQGVKWQYKDNENKRIWQVNNFSINNIIYVNTSGTAYGLGTIDMPVNTLQGAYKIANKRNQENNTIDTEYYIVLQTPLTISSDISQGIKLNDDIEVIITSKIASENINYNSPITINTGIFNFIGDTTFENITLNTTGYNNNVEFFGNGNNITFGEGVVFNSAEEKYPIIYGGGNTNDVQTDSYNLKVLSGKYNMIFGGGKEGNVNSNINVTIGGLEGNSVDVTQYGSDNDNYTGVFGAGRNGSVTGDIKLTVNSGEFHRVYGAGLKGETKGNVTINFKGGTTNRLYGAGQRGKLKGRTEDSGNVVINLGDGTGSNIAIVKNFLRGSGQYQGIEGATNLNIYNGTILSENTQVAAGGYQGNVQSSNLSIYGGTIDCDVYGGGWGLIGDPNKGLSGNTNVYVHDGVTIDGDVYGGGYAGNADNTTVVIGNATLHNVYGGGNEAKINENTNVKLISTNIIRTNTEDGKPDKTTGNAYGGGKGVTATVIGNSSITIEGTTNIAGSVFGGGNAAMTGLADENSTSNVYIVGGTINEDVYGGANTAIVYGETNVKIGKEAVKNDDLIIGTIDIKGTVFGGGKSNAAGSEDYDFTFESVTGNVYMDINAKDAELNIGQSIFASGNAAKILGDGYVTISNYGTRDNPEHMVSIQRATEVTLDNSSIWLLGTTDTTNEISTAIYTVNRVNDLKLKSNSTLYLSSGVNIVENLHSLTKNNEYEVVKLENGILEQNVDNKIYVLHGKNIELLTEDGRNGSVHGMMFLGKFDGEQSVGQIKTGIYANSYVQGDTVKDEDKNALHKNSYLQAQHYTSHDIQVDGFYTNAITEENTIDIQYIIPTPEDGTYYQWFIGELSENIYYEDIELIASQYSSTAQITLNLVGLNAPDMTLEVEYFDTTLLKDGVILKNEIDIPNMAESAEKANSEFGLTMSNGQQGWSAKGTTYYLHEDGTSSIDGTKMYYADKSNTTPTLTFNFAHSRNVTEAIELGEVTIGLKATYMENEELISKNVTIELKLRVNNISSTIDYYEGAMTPGLKYTVFPNATTSITSKSSVSAYYSIYMSNYDTQKYYPDYEGYYHRITSSFVLPQGTKIVMIDKSKNNDEYYYYIVTAEDELNGVKSYNFTDFISMGTLDKYYNNDSSYYNKENNYVLEEFVFQVNFENTRINQNYLNQTLKIELIDETDDSVKLTVNDAMYPMMYHLYYDKETEKTLTIDKTGFHFYEPENLDFVIDTKYIYQIANSTVVYDTTNFENAEGLKVTFFLGTEQLTKEELGGISISCNNSEYFVRDDGSISFKIADMVSNLETKMRVNLTQKENWEPGTYTMRVEAIASTDGEYALNTIASGNVSIIFSSSEYGLDVILDENSQLINNKTGKTLNDTNTLDFDIKYATGLEKPSIRIALYRRDYENVYTPNYNLVDLADYVQNDLVGTNKEKEYLVTNSPTDSQEYTLKLKENLKTGTYKIKFLVYDGENYIGEIYKMIIIKEDL